MSLLIFQVRGTPGAQGSKNGHAVKKGGKYTGKVVMYESSEKVAPWRSDVKAAAEAALLASDDWPHRHDGPVHFTCTFMFPRPKSHYRTGKLAGVLKDDAPIYVTSQGKGDLDKLMRSTFDALTAAQVWADDSLAVTSRSSKVYGDQPGAHLVLATDNEVTIPSVVSR